MEGRTKVRTWGSKQSCQPSPPNGAGCWYSPAISVDNAHVTLPTKEALHVHSSLGSHHLDMAGCSYGWPQFLAPQEVKVTFHDPNIPSKITPLILSGWPKAPRQFWSSMTFQGLRDYLPEAESKGQASVGARLNSLPHRCGTCDLKNIMST